MTKKLKLMRIKNSELFNEIDIEKSNLFLDSLQDFVVDIGLKKIEGDFYEYNNKNYDMGTFYVLFDDDIKEGGVRKKDIKEFEDGETVRYAGNKLELLIIFLESKIKLIFYCSLKEREKIIDSISKFVDI